MRLDIGDTEDTDKEKDYHLRSYHAGISRERTCSTFALLFPVENAKKSDNFSDDETDDDERLYEILSL
jgi:hypothetical protein